MRFLELRRCVSGRVVVCTAALLAACSSEPLTNTPAATAATTAPSITAVIPHRNGAADVVLQIGDYNLGAQPDMFVTGPEIVLYGDGSLYAELFDGTQGDQPQWSRMQAQLSESQVQTLLRMGEKLPIDATTQPTGPDSLPTLIVSATHSWEVNDPEAEPFATYLADLRNTVRSMATEEWSPGRWIVRVFPSPTCTVANIPASQSYFDAPVYPGLLSRFPLGVIDCYSAAAARSTPTNLADVHATIPS